MDEASETRDELLVKKSFKKIKFGVDRIVKIAIPHHLNCLSSHCANFEKYQNDADQTLLHQEQINALNAVRSLKADIQELELLNAQVVEEDQEKIAEIIQTPIRQVAETLTDFLALHSDLFVPLPQFQNETLPVENIPKIVSDFDNSKNKEIAFQNEADLPVLSLAELQVLDEPIQKLKTWEKLKKEISELNGLFRSFASSVFKQKEKVDTIENHVQHATENVLNGTRHLKKAVALQVAVLPFAGAALGSLLGPVGSVIGFHAFGSIACALGGTGAGFFIGNKIKQARIGASIDDIELKAIESSSRCLSHSMPDLQVPESSSPSEEPKKDI